MVLSGLTEGWQEFQRFSMGPAGPFAWAGGQIPLSQEVKANSFQPDNGAEIFTFLELLGTNLSFSTHNLQALTSEIIRLIRHSCVGSALCIVTQIRKNLKGLLISKGTYFLILSPKYQ